MKGMIGRMGRTDWFLAGATTVMVALALASVVAAALGCMPLQQPTETTPIWDLAPLPPLPTDAIPGPTVFPEDFWGPRERRVTTGPATAGSLITVYRTDIQLPPNVYVKQKWTSTDCRMGCVCPGRPGV